MTIKTFYFLLSVLFSTTVFSQCPDCGNGLADAGETNNNCPQDIARDASCASPCSQPDAFETTVGLRDIIDFTGTTTFGGAALPTGWTFASAPTSGTAGLLSAAGTDAYGAKAGLVQPNCSGSCTSTNGFCIGNLANSVSVGTGGTNGKLGANFDGRANINQNLSYAVLRGQNNPTLVSPAYNVSAVEGFKIQFWLAPSETACTQSNSWGSCSGNVAYLDFSVNGTSWTQILTMNLSSTNSDMCTNNSTNTLWMGDGKWSRVCLTVFKSSSSPGNFYTAATASSAASGIMVNSSYFSSTFRYRIRYAQSALCTSGIAATNPGRYLAIDYPVFTSGNQMIPCGISFSNLCGYGADANDDGVGSNSATTNGIVFSTVKSSVNQAERGVEILTSQTAAFASQNLSGSAFASNYDLCNAEGGDRQCIDWRTNTNFYTAVYECIADWEAASTTGISLAYYQGTTPQSTGMTKVTTAGKTATIGWRYFANRIVSCGSSSELNAGCNGYNFRSGSLPTQFARGFYQLGTNGLGESWTFYGASSCLHYFNGPTFAPVAAPDTVSSGAGNYITCSSGVPVFTGLVDYCSNPVGFSGSGQLQITGPNGFSETINSGASGTTPVIDLGPYVITAVAPASPGQCMDCGRSVCVTVTSADLDPCSLLPVELENFTAVCHEEGIDVAWCTASEKSNDHFILEQSADGLNFRTIGILQGYGNTEQRHCYKVKAEPLAGINYFRLGQNDQGQRLQRPAIISVPSCKTRGELLITNDGSAAITVSVHSPVAQSLRLYVHDVLGRLVYEEQFEAAVGATEHRIRPGTELRGIYSVSLYAPQEKLAEKKILIATN